MRESLAVTLLFATLKQNKVCNLEILFSSYE